MGDDNYEEKYNENAFWDKILKFAKEAGSKLVYSALVLFFAAQNPKIPVHLKATIYSTLGYFIWPLDVIPDLTPTVGYSDDLGAIMLCLSMIAMYIDDDVKSKALSKYKDLLGNTYNETE